MTSARTVLGLLRGSSVFLLPRRQVWMQMGENHRRSGKAHLRAAGVASGYWLSFAENLQGEPPTSVGEFSPARL